MAARDVEQDGQTPAAHGGAPADSLLPPGAACEPFLPPPDMGHVLLAYVPVLAVYVWDQQRRRRRKAHPIWLPRLRDMPADTVACIQTYRLDRGGVEELCQVLGPHLRPRVASERNIPVLQKVLMGLHFLATGNFQAEVAQRHGTSQSSASRCLRAFLEAMFLRHRAYIHFPKQESELMAARADFFAVAGFPNVIGAVDGTHVSILAPKGAPGVYRDRHHQYSINVQATCSAQGYFTHISALFPGSVHDSQAFDNCSARDVVAAWPDGTGWLLGDRGYPLRPYLLTPYPVDLPGPRARYNKAHRRTRITIERAFGQLKLRFRCLHSSGGRLLRDPDTVSIVVIACAMLHNLCLRRKTPILDMGDGQGPVSPPPADTGPPPPQPRQDPRGVQLRDRITNQYFA